MHCMSGDRNELAPEVSRKVFGPKRDEVAVNWSKLHNKELHILYFSPCSL